MMFSGAAEINPTTLAQFYRDISLPPRSRSVRLLRVSEYTCPGHDDGPIWASLFLADLDQKPEFAALSYRWGEQNCHSALVHLRRKFGSFVIWVDALCIDQSNPEEKSHQLPLMGDIYSLAKPVYIWLGNGSLETDRAMRFLSEAGFADFFFEGGNVNRDVLPVPRIWRACWNAYAVHWGTQCPRTPVASHTIPLPALYRLYRKHVVRLTVPYTSHGDLLDLLSRDWATRIWTFQEAILTKRAIVLCGDYDLEWSVFAAAIVFLDTIRVSHHGLRHTLSTWKNLVTTRESIVNPAQRDKLIRYQEFLHVYLKRSTIRDGLFSLVFLGTATGLLFSIISAIHYAVRHATNGNRPVATLLFHVLALACVLLLFLFCFGVLEIRIHRMLEPKCPSHEALLMAQEENKSDDLTEELCTRSATHPKDICFGFRAVFGQLMSKDFPPPDYDEPIGNIYYEVVTNLLESTASLQFLMAASIHRLHEREEQPSWIPDWSVKISNQWRKPYLSFQYIESACPETKSIFRLDSPSKILSVNGSSICTIEKVLNFRVTAREYHDSEHWAHVHNINNFLQMYEMLGFRTPFWDHPIPRVSKYFTPDFPFLVFDSPLVANLPGHVTRDPHILSFYLDTIMANRHRGASEVLTVLQNTKQRSFMGYGTFRWPTCSPFPALFDLHVSICNAFARARERIFLVNDLQIILPSAHPTEREGKVMDSFKEPGVHRSVGVCTVEAGLGDHVVVLPGLATPLVLRPAGEGRHRLVSPAIVFGAMKGQAFRLDRGLPAVHPPLETFDLC